MEKTLLRFRADQLPQNQHNTERAVFTAEYDGQQLTLGLGYDVDNRLLPLSAHCAPSDTVQLEIEPHRVALFVNGALADENWPWGNALFTLVSNTDTPVAPAPLKSCRSWKGLCPEGVRIGDCMPYSDATDHFETLHLFWLYDRRRHLSKWSLGAHQWAHSTTKDLAHWQEHEMAVPITDPMEGSICTGSVIRKGDLLYAWYAQRMSDRSPARIRCAVSRDGEHFEKQPSYFTMPAGYEPTSARDPKVVCWDGLYHMLVTTTDLASGKGCLAHLTSRDMETWEDAGILLLANSEHQPECPDWFEWNGRFYLLGGIMGTAYYMVSDQPFSGFSIPEDPQSTAIPCGRVPKSALLGNRRIFFGFEAEVHTYAGPLLAVEALQQADGSLRFEPIALA